MFRRTLQPLVLAGLLALSLGTGVARAQSEASQASLALPVASVVAGASVAGASAATTLVIPAALSVSGAVLVIKAVEVSAKGTVWVLERASDAATASVELGASALASIAYAVGTAVSVTVVGAGVILSVAGQAIAFIPNRLGQALLHHEQISH